MNYRDRVRFATKADFDSGMPVYSHSITTAILTCPKWGIIRYMKGLYFKTNYRAMALEAGSAMHEVFSSIRLWQLWRKQGLKDHAAYHGKRLFNTEEYPNRWETILKTATDQKRDPRNELEMLCFGTIHTGTFYDDPRDKNRTIANLEEATLRFVKEQWATMDRNQIWVEDENDPTSAVGIENTWAIVVDEKFIYIGTVDGISVRADGKSLRLEELKTASRLDDAFRRAFEVSQQPTGYMVMSEMTTGLVVEQTRILGIKVKQTGNHEDYIAFEAWRDNDKKLEWLDTINYAHNLYMQYKDDVLNSPMFTHSCNRYYNPCGFVDLCAGTKVEQQWMFEDMEPAPKSPSQLEIERKLAKAEIK